MIVKGVKNLEFKFYDEDDYNENIRMGDLKIISDGSFAL